jgi:hypothetical protein
MRNLRAPGLRHRQRCRGMMVSDRKPDCLPAADPHSTTAPLLRRALITAFISFVAEWKYRARLIDLIEHGSREPFFLHIFRGCLLFESILKENSRQSIPSGKVTLGNALQRTHGELGIPNDLNIRSCDFDAEVRGLSPHMPTTAAIQMTGKIRNTLGHNLAWPSTSLDQSKYNLAVKNIAAACLHAVSTLYR